MHDIDTVQAVLDCFKSHGHNALDTARTYGAGTSEEYLGKLDVLHKGFEVHTKVRSYLIFYTLLLYSFLGGQSDMTIGDLSEIIF